MLGVRRAPVHHGDMKYVFNINSTFMTTRFFPSSSSCSVPSIVYPMYTEGVYLRAYIVKHYL